VTCCNQKNNTFDVSNYWSKPVQLTDGDPAGLHLTGTAAYDFNTSLATSQTDANNLTTSFSYDAGLRLQQKTLPTGATVTTTYNDAALTASTTMNYVEAGQNRSITTSAVYNGWGQATQTLDAANNQVNIGYDSMQRVCAQTNPFALGGQPGPSTTYSYDGLGRVRVTTLPDTVNTIQYAYSGTTRTITDQVNRQIKQEQDGLGQIVKVTEKDANGQLTQETDYTYDVLGDLTQVNQGGQTRSLKYDSLRRLLFEMIPEQSATIDDGTGTFWSSKYTWTDFHAISTKQDARGALTSYGYDALNRLTSVTYDTSNAPGVATTPNVTYNYDTSSYSSTKGLLFSVGVGSGYSESYGYDSFNRVSSVTHTIDGRGYGTSYQYNTIDQQTQMVYASGRVVNVNHDNSGRVSSLADQFSANYVSGIGYNNATQVTGWTLGNGVVEGFTYDSQLLQMTSQSATRSGTTLLSLTYGYAANAGQNGTGSTAGNISKLMSANGTINGTNENAAYTYDLQGRLATSSQTSNGTSAQRRFQYDRWGNRTGMWDAVSGGNQIQSIALQQSGGAPTNQITTVNGVGYGYDAAGNVTGDGAHSYSYDAENRVVSVDGGGTAQYSYDHRNWRVKKIAGATTHYIWERGQVIAEHNASTGAVQVDYLYAGGRMIAKESGGSRQYPISDRLSVRMTLDSSGNVTGRQAHLPYGEDFAETGAQEKHHFTSYERDAESGLDYAVNRHAATSIGRFNQVDPIRGTTSNPQSLNRYAYVANDPINSTDPQGLCPPGTTPDPETGECVGGEGGNPVVLSTTEYTNPEVPDWSLDTGLFIDGGFGPSSGTGIGDTDTESELQEPAIPKRLSPCLKKILGKYYNVPGLLFPRPLDLNSVRLHNGLPAIAKYAVIDVGGITLGNDIYFANPNEFTISKLAHELVHVEQYAKYTQAVSAPFLPGGEIGGIVAFATQYLAEFAAQKALGKSDDQAYASISFEVEANKRELQIVDAIKQQYGDNPCGVPLGTK
jgi:RHS repeat-associated protein